MVSGLFTLVMAAALSQAAPAEAAWLKSIPADADVLIHAKGLSSTRDELLQMLTAMSPTLGQMAGPTLQQGVDAVSQRFGPALGQSAILVALKLPKPDGPGGPPPFVVLVPSESYEGTLKNIAGPNADFKLAKQEGGYDKFTDQDGQTIYSLKGAGFVAFSLFSEDLIRSMAAKPGASMADKLNDALREHLFGGDLGAYVSVLSVQNQYGDQIEQARQGLMGVLDQAAGQMQAAQIEQAKKLYGAMFDAIKLADGLALNFNFEAKAFTLSGLLTVKPGTDAAESLARARLGAAENFSNLPTDAMGYVYLNVSPETLVNLQQLNVSGLGPKGDNAESKAAIAALKAAGRQEAYSAFSIGGGINIVNVSYPENPRKVLDASTDMMKAMKSSELFKDVQLEENALAYKGFELSKATVTFDLAKMASGQPNNPGGEEALRKMFGGDTMTTWYGTDGKRVASVVAKSADEAKSKIDAIVDGKQGIGQSAGFKAARALLPEKASMIVLINAQEMVKQLTKVISSFAGQNLPAPAGMPKEAVLFGGSIAATPEGYHFDFAVPSAVGPVFEKGFGPLMMGIQGQVNQ